MVEKIIEVGILYDLYGDLLKDKQKEIMELYYIEDFSLSEIAENLKISRQSVYDNIKRGEKSLYNYEEKLRILEKMQSKEKKAKEILDLIENIENNKTIDKVKKIALEILE